MATSIDVWNIKTRIVDILDSDTDLYDATGASDKVRKITTGAPRMSRLKNETTIPQIWVTNDDVIFTAKSRFSVQSNAPNAKEYVLNLKLILLDDAKDGPKTEEKLDDFVQLIDQTIMENYDLRDPDLTESSSVADNCEVVSVSELSPQYTGLAKSGRIIKLRATITGS